jgi:hypothetical protein
MPWKDDTERNAAKEQAWEDTPRSYSTFYFSIYFSIDDRQDIIHLLMWSNCGLVLGQFISV